MLNFPSNWVLGAPFVWNFNFLGCRKIWAQAFIHYLVIVYIKFSICKQICISSFLVLLLRCVKIWKTFKRFSKPNYNFYFAEESQKSGPRTRWRKARGWRRGDDVSSSRGLAEQAWGGNGEMGYSRRYNFVAEPVIKNAKKVLMNTVRSVDNYC